MLSVLAAGPASAVGKHVPVKKDPKICVKWVKVVKVNWDKKKSDTFKVKKFLWVKKSKYLLWKDVKDWDLKKGQKFLFFKIKGIDKKDCWDKNAKKFKKGSYKKPIFPEPPVPPVPPDRECRFIEAGDPLANPLRTVFVPVQSNAGVPVTDILTEEQLDILVEAGIDIDTKEGCFDLRDEALIFELFGAELFEELLLALGFSPEEAADIIAGLEEDAA